MKKQEVVEFLKACQKECEMIWKDIRPIQQECYERYRSFRDFSKKKTWQHKIVVPTVYPAIKGSAGLIRRILMKSPKFFEFVAERQDNAPQQADAMGRPVEDLTDNFARAFTKVVRFRADECNFIDRFAEAVESAFVMQIGILRFIPRTVTDARVVWGPLPSQAPPPMAALSEVPLEDEGVTAIEDLAGEEVTLDSGGVPGVTNPAGELAGPVTQLQPAAQVPFGFVKEEVRRGKLDCEVVNPLLLQFPLDRSYFIEETRVPLHSLMENTESLPFDRAELNRLKRDDYDAAPQTQAERDRLKMLKLTEQTNEFRPMVVLHTYWGPLTDRKGKLIVKDCRFVVANEKYLILKPSPSPYWLRAHPYIFLTPLKVLFFMIGAGMIDGIRPLINAIDNLVNIAGDKALYSLLPITEVNSTALKDDQQLTGGLHPGKTIQTQGPLGQAIHQTATGDIPQGVFVLVELLKKFAQNYHGWTEFMQGMPTTKGDVTATEVQKKTEASSISFENIAASLEKDGVIGSVELIRDLVIQYFLDPVHNPETYDMFLQEKINLDVLPVPQRFAFLNKRYPIKVEGLTAFFDKESQRRDLVNLVSFLAQVPALVSRLNLEEFLKRLFTSFEWMNPEALILTGPLATPPVDPTTGKPTAPQGPATTGPDGGPGAGTALPPELAAVLEPFLKAAAAQKMAA